MATVQDLIQAKEKTNIPAELTGAFKLVSICLLPFVCNELTKCQCSHDGSWKRDGHLIIFGPKFDNLNMDDHQMIRLQ